MRNISLAIKLVLTLSLFGCYVAPIQPKGDGVEQGYLVVNAASSGIAGLLDEERQLFIARKRLSLDGIAVLYQVSIDGHPVGRLANGEKASYAIAKGERTIQFLTLNGNENTQLAVKSEIQLNISDKDRYLAIWSDVGWFTSTIEVKEVRPDEWTQY